MVDSSDDLASGDAGGTLLVELAESRYDRQQRVAWWDQELLSSAKVLVVGAGALGNEVVKNLALVGVGNIVVMDIDVVESSNLARCVFFRAEDEGSPKATVLAVRASEVNPEVTITGIVGDVRSLGTGIALRADVIVGALDNREARLFINRLAARTGKAWVDGAIEALNGIARVFSPPTVCYECTFGETDWLDLAHRQSCRLLSKEELLSGKVPTTASTSSIVAGIEAQEVVKLLHVGRPGVFPLSGAVVFDGANNDCYPLTYPSDPDCLAHHFYLDPICLELDQSGFAQLTFQRIAETAWPELITEPEFEVVIDLGDDHVVGWNCTACGGQESENRPAALIAWGDARCPQCEDARQPQFITSISIPGVQSDLPIVKLGIRIDEIVVVRAGPEERYVWLKLLDASLPLVWNDMHNDLQHTHDEDGSM
jgi:adenylyltransferase/sulfurtransferase